MKGFYSSHSQRNDHTNSIKKLNLFVLFFFSVELLNIHAPFFYLKWDRGLKEIREREMEEYQVMKECR